MSLNIDDKKFIISTITQTFQPLEQGQRKIQKDVSGLKQDVSGLKQDVSGLKQDVSGLKQGQKVLKKEIRNVYNVFKKEDKSLRKSIISVHKRVEVLEKEHEEGKKLAQKYHDEVLTGFDKVLKEIKDMRLEQKVLTTKVYKDHEPRIKDIEKVIFAS
jgi:predicted  nucleic acid-binding Zn-ribbon protein